MKNSIWSFLLVSALVIGAQDVAAKRLGGGTSPGKPSGQVAQPSATSIVSPSVQAPVAATASRVGTGAAAPVAQRPWGTMLGGVTAGLGLAWLASSLGFGEGLAQLLLVVLVMLGVLSMLGMWLRRRAPQPAWALQPAGGPGLAEPVPLRAYHPKNVGNDASARPWESGVADTGSALIGAASSDSTARGVPADFDVAGFLNASKANFISLQGAWDRSDMVSLRAMMTDDMLEQIQHQLNEREQHAPGVPNETDVVMLEAQLLGIEELADGYLANVEFSGLIREDASAGPSPFREIWSITRAKGGAAGWLVAGVQALQ